MTVVYTAYDCAGRPSHIGPASPQHAALGRKIEPLDRDATIRLVTKSGAKPKRG